VTILSSALIAVALPLVVNSLYAQRTLGGDIGTFVSVTSLYNVFTIPISTAALLVVKAGIIYLLARGFGGCGTFRDTIKAVAIGYFPLIVSGLVLAVLTRQAYVSIGMAQIQTPTEMAAALKATPYRPLSTWVRVLSFLWQGHLWTFALRHIHDISLRQSVLVCFPAVVATVLLSVPGL